MNGSVNMNLDKIFICLKKQIWDVNLHSAAKYVKLLIEDDGVSQVLTWLDIFQMWTEVRWKQQHQLVVISHQGYKTSIDAWNWIQSSTV